MVKVKIRAAAQRRGIENSNQLANKIGVTRTMAGRYWEGSVEPTLSILEKICNALDCELSELVTLEKKRRLSHARQKRATKSGKTVVKR